MRIFVPRSTQLILLAAVAVVLSTTVSVCRADHDPEMKELMHWFQGRKGTEFNPNQEIRRVDPDDPTSMLGVFATADIAKGEVLVSIPWDTLIHSGETVTDPDPLTCGTVRNLANEMRKGDDSKYAPYTKYLMSQKVGQLPSAWSKEGKLLFKEVLGEELPPADPVSWLEDDWRQDCQGSTDPLDEQAALLVVSRSEDDLMLPIYDMYAHRNGKYNNVDNNREEGKRFYLSANRDVSKGEQLYNSYNMCNNCGGRANSYGTPDIFRDYGFVEQLPQRWIFADRKFAFDLREGKGPNDIVVSFAKNVTLSDETIAFLRKEMLRLERLKKLEADNTDIDPYELEMTWEYADAMVKAFRLAILATPGAELDGPCDADDKACSASDGYDSLDDEKDDLYFDQNELSYFKPITCDNREIMFFNDYDLLETPKSVYQTLNYVEKKDIDDVCFDLDDVVQICSSYRPHYHEYNMDYAARYLDDVRRVVFVGGGDSMLLYETLKYPNIEKVVGLELDQKVVRNSFKYFHTQPHFDDERVEWWFGDATKSILMLPRDYFGSFDLVLIDLSETVMSLSVNKKLDVFNALALLLRPDGIMVKNELYLEKISELFDYTAQIYVPDLPIICDQVVVMGSNTVDFFRQERKDHAVGTKLLEPNEKHRLELFHDYRRTSALEEGKCDADEAESSEDNSSEGRSSILMVAEVENTTVPLKPFGGLVKKLVQVLKDGGMHPNDTNPPDDGAAATVIPMTEGHVTVRVWPDLKYCALDIHLWSSFNKMEHLRDELVKALGSDHSSLSSYRIVTGGMRGTSTWDEDHKTIGPLIEQRRNCDGVDYVREGDLNSKETRDIIMDEALGLIQREKVSAAVLCGPTKEDCKSLEAVSRHKTINEVIAIPTCPELAAASEFSENIGDIMLECEKEILKVLRAFASSKGSISAIVVDPSAPVTMLKIASSIWSSQRNFVQLMTEDFFILSLMPDHRDTWRKRHNLIDRVRKAVIYDPMFAAELVISSSDETMEVGILSAEDTDFFLHLDDVVKNLERRTSGLDVVVRKVQGALVISQKNYKPRYFRKDEYDNKDALNQYASQKSYGRQTVFQFAIEDGGAPTASAAIKKALSETIADLKYTVTEGVELIEKGIGDGAMASAVMKEGTVVVTWDGDVRVDINLFTFDETEALATDFMTKFSERIPKLKLLLRDNQPRGINRVVNFAQESIKSEEF